ncbi:biopolymer transporter ExbD [Allorhodopirellula solitaria]|uniref:Biopolymer transport protein ExbD/TolR n=1 Tax=Allorhodopirellula solitaria TaxID=2527987 RepID=A0A5C5YBX5_9BACT|nr:biopolymer transporter ExbD [Allorhodopirellula solitaria]TWT73217.1 Biopolymer transport protein ExbD/TolR [Allorhodopirellula solitaria]
MSISVQCPSCDMRRKVNERLAGRTIRCPGCDQPLTIPAAVEAELHEPADQEADEGEVVAEAIPVASEASASVADTPSIPRPSGVPAQNLSGSQGPNQQPANAVTSHHAEHPPSALLHDDEDDALPPRQKRDDGELDMTPMVDVTFLLLIFFMVTASFSLQKSIKMPKQNSDLPSMSNVEEPTEELDPIELEIEENGSFLVLAADWERETPGKQNLVSALKQAIGANKDGMRLDIKVHENAKLQMLVDGMDAGTIAGFQEIQVAEVDGFD